MSDPRPHPPADLEPLDFFELSHTTENIMTFAGWGLGTLLALLTLLVLVVLLIIGKLTLDILTVCVVLLCVARLIA